MTGATRPAAPFSDAAADAEADAEAEAELAASSVSEEAAAEVAVDRVARAAALLEVGANCLAALHQDSCCCWAPNSSGWPGQLL